MLPLSPLKGRTEATAFKVEQLLSLAQSGQLRIPEFQRPPRWKTAHALALFDSLYQGYPIGTLLLARRSAPEATLQLGSFRKEVQATADAFWVVDGQQRVSALVGALLHPEDSPRSGIHAVWFDLQEMAFFRLTRARAPETAIPLRALGDSRVTLRWLRQWPLEQERPDLVERAIELSRTLREYEIPCAIVDGHDEQPLRKIFHRLNTAGVGMKEDEVFNALYSKESLNSLTAATIRLAETGFGELPRDFFLRCGIAAEGMNPATKSEALDEVTRKGMVRSTELALTRAIEFLIVDGAIPHLKLLPYRVPLIVLSRYFHIHHRPSARAKLLLRRWLWRGFLSRDFVSSSHGIVRKFQRVVDAMSAEKAAQNLLGELKEPLIEFHASDKWNARGANSLFSILAFAEIEPRDPRDERPLTLEVIQEVLSGDEGKPVPTASSIYFDFDGHEAGEVSNRVLVRDVGALKFFSGASQEVLADHFLDSGGVAGNSRKERVSIFVKKFLEERCEKELSDRVSISELTA